MPPTPDCWGFAIYRDLTTAGGLALGRTSAATLGPLTISSAGDGTASAYFNRGLVLSQFMAKQEKWHIDAALYELDDDVPIERLKGLGKKARLVLANGSKKKKGEDGNAKAAGELEGVIDLNRRMLWSEGLAHNKFVVFAKTPTKPFLVWTGSTNWASTGLCTQLNNGVPVEDAGLAQVYLDQWKLLKKDRRTGRGGRTDMHFGEALMSSNDEPKEGDAGESGKYTVWFTRTSEGQELEAATQLINGAKHATLFLMFGPGTNGLLPVVQARLSPAAENANEQLYIHGVVNTLHPVETGEDVHVELVGRAGNKAFDLRVVQPEGSRADWPSGPWRSRDRTF